MSVPWTRRTLWLPRGVVQLAVQEPGACRPIGAQRIDPDGIAVVVVIPAVGALDRDPLAVGRPRGLVIRLRRDEPVHPRTVGVHHDDVGAVVAVAPLVVAREGTGEGDPGSVRGPRWHCIRVVAA